MEKRQTIIALSAHTDDAELGMGATLYNLTQSGREVMVVSLSSPKVELVEEFKKASKVLGVTPINMSYSRRRFPTQRQEILDSLIELREQYEPEVIFLPSKEDRHQDHAVVHSEAIRAFPYAYKMFTYELPWNQISAENMAYSRISKVDVDAKIRALKCYKSQSRHHYFSPTFIRSLAKVRGVQIKQTYAEAFGVIRDFICAW